MFLKKFFAKNFKHFKEKGDKYLEEERYADARHEYLDALQRLEDCEDPADAELQVLKQLTVAGDRLAILNIAEAEHAFTVGDAGKARDHLLLACELGKDPEILARAAQVEKRIGTTDHQPAPVPAPATTKAHSCTGCGSGHGDSAPQEDDGADHLVAEDRFAFLLHTLPQELASRYAAMGEKFAYAYLASHDGNEGEALGLYQELAREREPDDILLYETAILYFRQGNVGLCDKLLRQALELNPHNELCCLGMVQLLTETGRAPQSIPLLERMVAEGMLAGQALLTLGDVLLMMGEEAKAMETLLPALKTPAMAKAAAERLIPLLEKQNRREEAAYLFKTHMKGCC